MATVYIPTMLQSLSRGDKQVTIQATTVRQVVDELEKLYPGIKERLVEAGELRQNMTVAVDGELARMGLLEKLAEDCEVHFIPAIGGGALSPPRLLRK